MNAHAEVFLSPADWREALGTRAGPNWPAAIRGVTPDSRQVRPGVVFVAVRGHKGDGHQHVADAIRKGALALVLAEPPNPRPEIPHVVVDDTRAALARLAATFQGHPSRELNITGITGTNGKTTVAAFVKQLLEARGHNCGQLGTVAHAFGGREIPARRTTPGAEELQSLLRSMVDAGCTHCAMEISSHALDQRRVEALEVHTAVFTNLSRDHLDYHGDMESYFAAKAALFRFPALKRRIVGDDAWSLRLAKEHGDAVITCGLSPGCAVRAEVLEATRDGTRARVKTPWGEAGLSLPLAGGYNLRNALQAIAAVSDGTETFQASVAACASLRSAPGRLEPIPAFRGRVLVDYAHTPDALTNVLAALRPLTPGRLFVVFGCGGDRDRGKRTPMAAAASAHADALVLTNDNPRTENPNQIFADMVEGIPPGVRFEVVPDRAAAIRRGVELLGPEDTLLIAGKGHETVQEFQNARVPFDDRAVARACVEELQTPEAC